MTDDMALDIIVDEALRAADYTDKTSNYGMMGAQEVASAEPPSSLTPINLEQVVSEIFRDLEVIDSTTATIPCCTTSRLIGGEERLVLSAGTCINLDDGSRIVLDRESVLVSTAEFECVTGGSQRDSLKDLEQTPPPLTTDYDLSSNYDLIHTDVTQISSQNYITDGKESPALPLGHQEVQDALRGATDLPDATKYGSSDKTPLSQPMGHVNTDLSQETFDGLQSEMAAFVDENVSEGATQSFGGLFRDRATSTRSSDDYSVVSGSDQYRDITRARRWMGSKHLCDSRCATTTPVSSTGCATSSPLYKMKLLRRRIKRMKERKLGQKKKPPPKKCRKTSSSSSNKNHKCLCVECKSKVSNSADL